MTELYECEGKGGRYERLGVSTGAGTSRDELRVVYRDTVTGALFHRTPADFGDRMRPLEMPGVSVGYLRAVAVANLPAVSEALQKFSEYTTEDNAVLVVREVMRAVTFEPLPPFEWTNAQQNAWDFTLTSLRRNGFSIDGANGYKRDICDAIVGALARGAQCHTPPPDGHWLTTFYEIGRAERDLQDGERVFRAGFQRAYEWLCENAHRLHGSACADDVCDCGLSKLMSLLHAIESGYFNDGNATTGRLEVGA